MEEKTTQQNEYKYQPLEINLGVFFTCKQTEQKNSLSINQTRGGIKFKFTSIRENDEKLIIERKLSTNSVYLFSQLLRSVLADRQAIIKKYYEENVEGPIPYSVLPEIDYEMFISYYSKENSNFVDNGKITVSTVEIEGTPRVCITGYDANGNSIPVVLYETIGNHAITKASKISVVDTTDLDFYRLCMEIERSSKNTLIYNGFDKIYQVIKGQKSNSFIDNIKKTTNSIFGKKETPAIDVNDSDEDGIDIF